MAPLHHLVAMVHSWNDPIRPSLHLDSQSKSLLHGRTVAVVVASSAPEGFLRASSSALGPVAPNNVSVNTPDNIYGYNYNPRCLKRDFLDSNSASNLAYANVSSLLQLPNIHLFRPTMDQVMHPASHSSIGGDLFDLFSSPTDPAFYLLHSMIDRLWTIWQGQDYASRTYGLDGTVTFLDLPPSPNATLATVMKMFAAGGDMPILDAMSTFNGKYCYKYDNTA